jgi:hypothetical protein
MLNHLAAHTLPLLGAATVPAFRYLTETRVASTLEFYDSTRTRSAAATAVLNLLSGIVASVMLSRGVDREELFERYDVKLWSYDDRLSLFCLTTVPPIAVMAVVFGTHRVLESVAAFLSK